MRITLAILVLTATGCGHDYENVLRGDVTFTALERVEVERGASWLSSHTNGPPLEIVWDAPHDESGCGYGTIQRRPLENGGLTSGAGHCITLGTNTDERLRLDAMAAHEFGHWRMGSEHVASGLMQRANATLTWSDEDHALCVAKGRCYVNTACTPE